MGRKTIYPPDTKIQVKKLLSAKKSYREITQLTGVPKSTISTWFAKTIAKPWNKKTQREHLINIRKIAAVALQKKWDEYRKQRNKITRERVQKELPSYPWNNLGFYKSLLAMLYWAEGAKHKGASGPKFVNTDPGLMLLYITLLRKCYKIDEAKLRARIHIHHYHSPSEIKNFWSHTLTIPLTQFGKVYIKKRSKTRRFRRNFSGICFVYYGDSMIRKELMELGSTLGHIITNNRLTPKEKLKRKSIRPPSSIG